MERRKEGDKLESYMAKIRYGNTLQISSPYQMS